MIRGGVLARSAVLAVLAAGSAYGASPVLWSRRPASVDNAGWEHESYPIGNGWFGANVFGTFAWYGGSAFGSGERVQLTENSMLTHHNLTDALEFDIQFRGNGHSWSGKGVDFRRSLDLTTGIADVVSKVRGIVCRREYFCSYPDRVLVMRFEKGGAETNALDVSIRPWVPFERPFGRGSEELVGRIGTVKAHGNVIDVDQHLQWYDVKFHGRMLVETDGKLETLDHTIEVAQANCVTVYFSCGTNYRVEPASFCRAGGEWSRERETKLAGEVPVGEIDARVAAAAAKGYARVKADHVADFSGLMNRVRLDLPGAERDRDIPTPELLKGCRDGRWSAALEETYFQYGRYLLVSSSRPGTLPANLQGVWNAHERSPWGSGYWHNINVQMNYWPAFVGNLAECFEPYARFNAAFRPVTRELVADYCAKHGLGTMPSAAESPDIWCVGTAVYPYVVCGGPGGHSGPGTGGFTAKLFADWWDFTGDREALRKYVWPTVHGMADFLTRCVVETNGLYLSKFSASPEQFHGGQAYTTVGCAFDQQMLWETGRDLIRFAEVLGTNDAVVARVRAQLDKYDPVQVGESGQIKEFREERKYGEIGEYHHRHISHLVGLYPGSLIAKGRPDWMAAARHSLTERGDESTGWALAHRLNCWARLGDGDHCLKLIRNLLAHRTYDNLWDAHPPFQIDGNFGATSGICEMLLQSQAGYIDLLPALPKDWASAGSFKGLRARGGYEVDCAWKDGRPVRVAVRGPKGTRPSVRFAGKEVSSDLTGDRPKSDEVRYPLATYTERVTVEFGSAADAQAAEARLMPLPPGKTIAFVTRWDAQGDRAVEMAKCLVEAGAPGTFYPGECSKRAGNERLLKLGQSVGTYRATRGNMPGLAPEPQWETIMSYRIDVETTLGTCVSTMALPYFSARDQNPDSGPRLGEAFLRAGYCGSSEPWDSDLNGTFGIPPNRWVNVVGFPCWNEGKPSQEDWDRSAGAIERAQKPDCPCGPVVMIGVHPPQDAADRAKYVPILRNFVSKPEVWACGKPDYDAWRLEYLNGSVRKVSVKGKTAIFEVTRLEPWETGGKGGCALAFTCPAKTGPVVLGVAAPHILPTSFEHIQGVLKWDPATHRASAAFTNNTGAALSDVVFTLRLPRAWTNGVRRLRVESLAAGEAQLLRWDLPIEWEDPVYKGGTRFFALQIDAVRADRTRARWYMTTRETRPEERIAAPRDCGRWMGPCTNALGEAVLKALSMPGAALPNVGDTDTYSRGEVWKDVLFRPMRVKSEVMFRGTDWSKSEQTTKVIRATPHFVYSVFEFESDADGVCELVGGPNEMLGAVTPDRFRRFANGDGPEARNAPLKVRKGLNRILFAYSIKRDWTSFEMSLDVRPADGVREIKWKRIKEN